MRQLPRSTTGKLSPISPGPSVTAVGGIAKAEPAPQPVQTPAFDGVVVEPRADVAFAHRDRHHRASGSEAHHGQTVAHLPRFIALVFEIAAPQLTEVVQPPTLERVVIEQRARSASIGEDGDWNS